MIEAAPLDARVCHRALATRDARFDGRFFVGVRTTGVYCRPVCPARTPRPENCRFFRCAAAAQDAGFRPCRRCRPETSPGTPAWLGTSATVSRALRLIGEGHLDHGNLPELAARLGVGERHLRRLFLRHLGASPQAVARTRRLLFAKRLIEETALPMTELALAAGFESQRRFNAEVKDAFGAPPRELRAARARLARAAGRGAPLELRLPYRKPFPWRSILDFLALRAIPGVECVRDGAYWRTFALDGVPGAVEVRCDAERGELRARLHATGALPLIRLGERLRRVFDLGADPDAIASVLGRDARLRGRLRALPGVRVPGAFDGFELAVRAVLGQQVSVRGATTLAGRLVERFGETLAPVDGAPPGLGRLFPRPERLARARLEGLGVPGVRAAALRRLASATARGELALDGSAAPGASLGALQALPGIGPWTAQYVAMRALGEPDALPEGDLGLRRALGRGRSPVSAAELRRAAEAWRPWRAYACVLLWQTEH